MDGIFKSDVVQDGNAMGAKCNYNVHVPRSAKTKILFNMAQNLNSTQLTYYLFRCIQE